MKWAVSVHIERGAPESIRGDGVHGLARLMSREVWLPFDMDARRAMEAGV
jgi:hypothetical protein